jgi:hypothetical protein
MEGRSKPIDEGDDQGASEARHQGIGPEDSSRGEPRAKTKKRIENRGQVMGWTTEPGDRNVVHNAENCEGKRR